MRGRRGGRPADSEPAAAFCFLRDAVDLVPYLCGHYLRAGFDRIVFIDDASSDGTYERLHRLAECLPGVMVERQIASGGQQEPAINAVALNLHREGFRFLFPFDADEFWDVNIPQLRAATAARSELAFCGRWVNFAQDRNRLRPSPGSLLSIRWRAPDGPSPDRAAVEAGVASFLSVRETKAALKSGRPVAFTKGQHLMAGGPEAMLETVFDIFHAPLRHANEISKRALNYWPRIAPTRVNADQSWQLAMFARELEQGRETALWAAHSVDAEGRLALRDSSPRLVRDNRLRRLLIRARLHLALALSLRGVMRQTYPAM